MALRGARSASFLRVGAGTRLLATLLVICGFAAGCGGTPSPDVPRSYENAREHADAHRFERLQREVERLRADLMQAEQVLIEREREGDGAVSRASAVSALAEASIRLERAATSASWRKAELDEARQKLGEADRRIQAGHFGAAVFFASRAARMADSLISEASRAVRAKNTLWVNATRLNVRSGPSTEHRVIAVLPRSAPVFTEEVDGNWALVRTPSGVLGWVYRPLLEAL